MFRKLSGYSTSSKIIDIDTESKRISISIRALLEDNAEDAADTEAETEVEAEAEEAPAEDSAE